MSYLFKLTNENNETGLYHQVLTWGENITHESTGIGDLWAKDGWIHAYDHPFVAALLHPIHVKFNKIKMWLAEGIPELNDCGTEVGCRKLTTIKEIPLPLLTNEQKLEIAYLCTENLKDHELVVNSKIAAQDSSNLPLAVAIMISYAAHNDVDLKLIHDYFSIPKT
jgi:hypothetical protein